MRVNNTLSRVVENFKPLSGKKVTLYTCGLTVYSQPHIGNWVSYIYWDVLVRILKSNGYEVVRVQNITDVGHLTSDEDAGEDKMLKSALKEGTTAWDVAEKYIKIADDEAYTQLGLIRPDHMPRATEYIVQQIEFVKELETKGFTYLIADGVYFDTSKLNDYGKLALLDIKGLQFGTRVADSGKKNPTDFALWKFSPSNEKRDMEWDSPWGKGFPGWHLECSVMARVLLGDTIDIHTGGVDHIPVHHTNEIAQSEAVTGKPFVSTWIHANHIKVEGTKMSKSLGNIFTLADIVSHGFTLDAFKLMILSKHYSTEGNFTWEIMEAAQNRLKTFEAFADLKFQTTSLAGLIDNNYFENQSIKLKDALNDDLNTSLALQNINETIDYISNNKGIQNSNSEEFNEYLNNISALLGLNLIDRQDIDSSQKRLIAQRETVRAEGNWTESDRLRESLEAQGIIVRDTPIGTIWSRI